MNQKFIQENNVVPPSEFELLIFPELNNLIRDESKLQLERLVNINYNYNLPKPKFDHSYQLESSKQIEVKVKSKLKVEKKKLEFFFEKSSKSRKKKRQFLYYFFIRFLLNISLMSTQNNILLKIVTYRDINIENKIVSSKNSLRFKLSDLQQYIINLSKLEKLIKKILSSLTVETILNQSHLSKNKPTLFYQIYFNKLKLNSNTKYLLIKSDWLSGDRFRTITQYDNFKINYYKSKLEALLNDGRLIRNLIRGYFFLHPKRRRRKNNIRLLYKLVKKNKLGKLIATIMRKLLRRRRLLWYNLQLNMVRYNTNFYLIGKDYRIYRKKVARTYKSQNSKYKRNFRNIKSLNAKYIKCVEFYYNRAQMRKLRKVLWKIYRINLYLRYFINRFSKKLINKKRKYYDSKFVVPINSKILSYNEILDKLKISKKKVKVKIFDTIIFSYKHHLEKRLLNNIRKRRQISLEPFIRKMEKEKYYPSYRKTKFNPRLRKWLMKYVHEELYDEYREYFSRPRVILDKREEDVEKTYAYLPRKPLLFQRDLNNRAFKRKKKTKFHIIRLTKP